MKSTAFTTFSVVLILFSTLDLQGQPNNQYLTNTTVPAPNAGSLGKYADIPVSYFTGVPDINIPFYTVTEGPLSLPVTINYHASGIKIAELASWVGLGWSLNAGGVITRTVQGTPDEDATHGYYNKGQYIPGPGNLNVLGSYLYNEGLGQGDTEPDLFTFNVGGYTGKFYIDHKNAPSVGKPAYQLIPQQDLKLEFTTDFTRFILIAPDGTRYIFGKSLINSTMVDAREFSHQYGEAGWKTYCSSWYLIQVQSADMKFSITLSYATEHYSYVNLAPCTQVEIMDGCPQYLIPEGQTTGPQCSGANFDASHYYFTTEVIGSRLTSITSSSSLVTFTPSTTLRQDLAASNGYTADTYPLASIQITSGSPEVVCKKFDFSYTYFQDSIPPTFATGQYYIKRLKLNQVQEKSCNESTPIINPAHIFTYEGNSIPYRLSKAVDHWGYNNGASQNESLIVSVPSTTVTDQNTNATFTYGSANRESNDVFMQKGVLKVITYPTGGKTFFRYEANSVQGPVTSTQEKVYLQSCLASPSSCCSTKVNQSAVVSFSIDELNPTNGNTPPYFKVGLANIPAGAGVTCANNPSSVQVQMFRSSDNAAMGPQYSFNILANTSGTIWTGNVDLNQLRDANHPIASGTNYYFKITSLDGYGSLKVYASTTTTNNKTVGGLRIKQINTSESGAPPSSPNANDIIKYYEYTDVTTPSLSSGIQFKAPVYGFSVWGIRSPDGLTWGTYWKLFFSEQSITPLFDFQGYHLGYKRVKEKYNTDGGANVYEFLFQQDPDPNNGNPNVYPYPPVQPTVTSGKETTEATYDASGTLLSQTSITGGLISSNYSLNAGNIYKTANFTFGCKDPVTENTGTFYAINFTKYYIRTNAYRVLSKAAMLDGVTTTTTYSYDNTNRFLAPTMTEVTNSNNKVVRTEFTYPHDLPAGCIRDSLLRKNIISEPWKTVIKVDGIQVNGTQKDFASYIASTGAFSSASSCVTGTFPRLYQIKNYEVTWNSIGGMTVGSWILKGTFNSYDPKGQPASFTTAYWGDPQSFTWRADGALLTQTFKSHKITYDYYPYTLLLRSITDIDERKTGFKYDKLMRLIRATKDNASVNGSGDVVDGNVTTEYTYHYKEFPDPNNWVKTKNIFSPSTGSSLNTTETFEYLDGLGRSLQAVKKSWSPTLKDVVTAVAYDNKGRINKQYAPFMTTTNTGAFATIPGGQKYTLTAYEPSPLNRISSYTPPDWYATTTSYGTNVSNEVGYSDGTTATSYYPANSLYKTTVTTPQSSAKNIETVTWKDKKGRVVMTRQKEAGSSTNIVNTYTLYDNKDRVAKVLPPGVGTGASDAGLRFEYLYDGADRMISKKVPDMAVVTMKYNSRDQLVLAQDGNLLALNKWMLTKYNDYGRPISNGLYTGSTPDPNGTLAYSTQHTATTYGTSGVELGKVTATQTWIPGFAAQINRTFTYSNVTGRLLTDNGNNHLNNATGSDNYTYTYDYAGNMLTKVREHKTSSSSAILKLTDRFTYDNAGRKNRFYHKINSNAEKQLAKYAYDFRDRLIDKSLDSVINVSGVNSYLQSIDYAYNEQNWLTSINGGSSFSALEHVGEFSFAGTTILK